MEQTRACASGERGPVALCKVIKEMVGMTVGHCAPLVRASPGTNRLPGSLVQL